MKTSGWILVLLSAGITVAANLLLRAGLDRGGGMPGRLSEIPGALWHLGQQPLFDLGLLLYGGAMLVWLRVVATEPLGIAYPVLVTLSFLFVTWGATVLFHESFSAVKAVGLAVIIIGLFIMSRG